MKVLVTGCAGFVGSHTVEALLALGEKVIGIDCFRPFYARSQKERNLSHLNHPNFQFIEADLSEMDLSIVKECDRVIHLAAQAGVGPSWTTFPSYVQDNILATERLLQASVGTVRKFVYASSSSVYGNAPLPYREDGQTIPVSPYGITKLAAEHLCFSYNIPMVALRYFTVYGPRQRPDMAFRIFIDAIRRGQPINLAGGSQSRDFTYISDIVAANIAAMQKSATGVFNIGGGSRTTLRDTITLIGRLVGKEPHVNLVETKRGDVTHTEADLSRAKTYLDYSPKISLEDGLRKEIAWVESL